VTGLAGGKCVINLIASNAMTAPRPNPVDSALFFFRPSSCLHEGSIQGLFKGLGQSCSYGDNPNAICLQNPSSCAVQSGKGGGR